MPKELSLFDYKDVSKFTVTELQNLQKVLKSTSSKAKSWVVRRAARSDLAMVEAQLKRSES